VKSTENGRFVIISVKILIFSMNSLHSSQNYFCVLKVAFVVKATNFDLYQIEPAFTSLDFVTCSWPACECVRISKIIIACIKSVADTVILFHMFLTLYQHAKFRSEN